MKKKSAPKARKPSSPVYADRFLVDLETRSLRFVVGRAQHLVSLDEVSARLRTAPCDALLDCYMIGGGVGLSWPMLNEDLSFRGLVKSAKAQLRRKIPT